MISNPQYLNILRSLKITKINTKIRNVCFYIIMGPQKSIYKEINLNFIFCNYTL